MAKTLVDLDDAAVTAIQRELGESITKKEAVNTALHYFLEHKARVGKLLDANNLDLGVGSDIADEQIMAGARR